MYTILDLIADFQLAAQQAVELFYNKYNRTDLLHAWRQRVYPQMGTIGLNAEYFFHGIGLAVKFPDKTVDFDFGDGNRVGGFDSWRLRKFADSQAKYESHFTYQSIEQSLLQLMQEGKIYQLRGDRNFYLSNGL